MPSSAMIQSSDKYLYFGSCCVERRDEFIHKVMLESWGRSSTEEQIFSAINVPLRGIVLSFKKKLCLKTHNASEPKNEKRTKSSP